MYHDYFAAIWRGTELVETQRSDAEDWLSMVTETPGVKIAGCVETKPDKEGPGGRRDCILLIPRASLSKFAVKRFKMGDDRPVWVEDCKQQYNKDVQLFLRAFRE